MLINRVPGRARRYHPTLPRIASIAHTGRLFRAYGATGAASGGYTSAFGYDSQDRLTSAISTVHGTGASLQDRYFSATLDNSGNRKTSQDFSSSTSHRISYYGDSTGTAGGGVGALLLVAKHTGADAGAYYPGYDGRGSVTVLVDADELTLVAGIEYGPWGDVVRATGQWRATPFLFDTKWSLDQGVAPTAGHWPIGLYDYGLRMYQPATGRFISRDPIREEGGLNPYQAFGGDPVNRTDFLGLNPVPSDNDDKWKDYIDVLRPYFGRFDYLDTYSTKQVEDYFTFIWILDNINSPGSTFGELGIENLGGFLAAAENHWINLFQKYQRDQGGRCQKAQMALREAQNARGAYEGREGAPGSTRVDPSAYGLDPGLFTDDATGFAASLFANADGSFTLAFRGTNDPVSFSAPDWRTNFRATFLGVVDAQYQQAADLARQVAAASLPGEVMFAGHSLGGDWWEWPWVLLDIGELRLTRRASALA